MKARMRKRGKKWNRRRKRKEALERRKRKKQMGNKTILGYHTSYFAFYSLLINYTHHFSLL